MRNFEKGQYEELWYGITAFRQKNPDKTEDSIKYVKNLVAPHKSILVSHEGHLRMSSLPGFLTIHRIQPRDGRSLERYDAELFLKQLKAVTWHCEEARNLGLLIVGQEIMSAEAMDRIIPDTITPMPDRMKSLVTELEVPAKIVELRR